MLVSYAAEENAETEVDLYSGQHSSRPDSRRTSACTRSPTLDRSRSTSFSWIVGSCVRNRFFSPVKMV